MHYLAKQFGGLSNEEKQKALTDILGTVTEVPKTRSDKYAVRLMSDYTDTAKMRLANWGLMQGISSGFTNIDVMTKGFVGGELIIVAGKTSNGKTTLAMNISNNIALRGHRVLFVTLEMTHDELTSRYMHINGGETGDYHTVAANTVFQDADELNWQDIDGLIENAVKQLEVDFVVIDHLHYFTRELTNVSEDLGRITKEIKKNAIRHNLPVMLISHVRKTDSTIKINGKQKRATIEDLRSSSYIAQDADIVLMVSQDEDDRSRVYVNIDKNRNRGYSDKRCAFFKFHDTKLEDMGNANEQ